MPTAGRENTNFAFLFVYLLFGQVTCRITVPRAPDAVCTSKESYTHPGHRCSDDYWYCSGEGAVPVRTPCDRGTRFDPETSSCLIPGLIRECLVLIDECPGAGEWPLTSVIHDVCPTSYITCLKAGNIFTPEQCPAGSVFNVMSGRCDSRENTPGCNGQAANLTFALDDPELVATIFLPNNIAFRKFARDFNVSIDELLTPSTTLSKILLNHVVPGVDYETDELSDGNVLFTLNANETLTVDSSAGVHYITIKPEGGDAGEVLLEPYHECGASELAIDTVLLPSNV